MWTLGKKQPQGAPIETMFSAVRKIGNSLGVILPSHICFMGKFEEGTELRVDLHENGVFISHRQINPALDVVRKASIGLLSGQVAILVDPQAGDGELLSQIIEWVNSTGNADKVQTLSIPDDTEGKG